MDFLVFISTGHHVLHPIRLSIYLCMYLSIICLSICLSMCLATYQSDYLTCIYLFLLTCDLTMALGSWGKEGVPGMLEPSALIVSTCTSTPGNGDNSVLTGLQEPMYSREHLDGGELTENFMPPPPTRTPSLSFQSSCIQWVFKYSKTAVLTA